MSKDKIPETSLKENDPVAMHEAWIIVPPTEDEGIEDLEEDE